MHADLIRATTGQEPCFDPTLVGFDGIMNDSPTDAFVEGWTHRNAVSKEQAEAMCVGCDVLEQCKAYAMAAEEPYGIWGGTRPKDRGIPPKYRP